MVNLLDNPWLIFAVAFVVLWLAAWLGGLLGRSRHGLTEELRADYGTVLGATLTLLGLIIGFSFSMAISRYDLRTRYEEGEANAIGTEYVRADILPEADAAKVRELLREYADLRVQFYETRNEDDLRRIVADTSRLQSELWAAVTRPAMAQPTPVIALALSGMDDVLNSQGYTQAAWWNRIPAPAWGLLFAIAICCNAMFGYGARKMEVKLFLVLPLVVAISFFLIADIDSPRSGVIRVNPQNLESLRASLR
jgi:hypothetical protein